MGEKTKEKQQSLTNKIVINVITVGLRLGIGVGMFISNGNENADADTITALVLQSVAAGTMIYVAFFEVLERERAKLMTNRVLQWSTTLLGFLLMTGLDNLRNIPALSILI